MNKVLRDRGLEKGSGCIVGVVVCWGVCLGRGIFVGMLRADALVHLRAGVCGDFWVQRVLKTPCQGG